MANRIPLIVDTGDGNKIKELPIGDNLNLTGSGIVGAGSISATSLTINNVPYNPFSGAYADLTGKPTIPATTDDITYQVHLDNATTVAHSALTYDATNNWTHFALPTGFNNSTGQLAVIFKPTGSDKTFQGLVEEVYTFESGGTKVKLTGNWKTYDPQQEDDNSTGDDVTPAGNIILGYLYDMEVKFPTVYYQKPMGDSYRSEIQGSLVLHRLKFSFGPLGVYETILDRVGKPEYKELYEAVKADEYISNRVQFTPGSQATIPVYEKNTNVIVKLKSTHPSPATLYSMTWEGDFTTKFYQRV